MKKSEKSRSRPGHKYGHKSGRKSGQHVGKPHPQAAGKTAAARTIVSANTSLRAAAKISPAAWLGPRETGRAPDLHAYQSLPAALGGRPSAAVRAAATYDNDDRSIVVLMMVPFFVIALSLGISQTVKPFISNLPTPSLTARAPVTSPTPPTVIVLPTPSVPVPPIAVPPVDQAALAAQRLAAWTPPALPWPRDLSPPRIDAPPLPISTAPVPRPQLPPVIIAPPAPVMTLPETPPLVAPPIIATPAGPDAPQFCARAPQPVLPAIGRPLVPPQAMGAALATAAVEQTKHFVIYSATYRRIGYPMGDLSSLYGACSDVIIRAYRTIGLDLQELVQRARSIRGDSNIDHRRTETLRKFFTQYGESLTPTAFPEDYQPGDIVTYYRPFSRISRAHIAIVSDVRAPTGRFMIAHNRGWGPQLEDALFVDRITGHYRFDGSRLPPAAAVAATGPILSARSATLALPMVLRQQRAKPSQLSRAPIITPISAVIGPAR